MRQIEGVPVLALKVEVADPKGLRDFAVKLQQRLKSGIVVLGAAAGEKAMLIALVSKDLTKRFPAGEIIKAIAPAVGGSGGGRPDMAQAGGPDLAGIPQALEQAYEVVAKKAKGYERNSWADSKKIMSLDDKGQPHWGNSRILPNIGSFREAMLEGATWSIESTG